jgi:hypothetical protein
MEPAREASGGFSTLPSPLFQEIAMRADNPSRALRKAVKDGSLPRALAALALGGDPNEPGSSGKTAVELARSRGQTHLLPALERAAAGLSPLPMAPSAPAQEPAPRFSRSASAAPGELERATISRPARFERFASAASEASVWEEIAERSGGSPPRATRLARRRP